MRNITPLLLISSLAVLLTACVDNPDVRVNQTDDTGLSDMAETDMGAEDMNMPDVGVDMSVEPLEGWEVTVLETDPAAVVQLVDTPTPRVVTVVTESGDVHIIDLTTGEEETLESDVGSLGVVWQSSENDEFVVGTQAEESITLQAWRSEKGEFAPFGGPLAELWLPENSGHLAYAKRLDGSLAMIDFVDQSALILDGSFGEGEVLAISESGLVLYRRADAEELVLFDPTSLEKKALPLAEDGEFLGDGTNLIMTGETLGTVTYDYINDISSTVVSAVPTSYESHGRYMAIHYEDVNDVLYDLVEQKRLAVGSNITVPAEPWSPDGRYFAFSARGPYVIDSTTNDLTTISGFGTIREAVFRGVDSEYVAVSYEGSGGPRMILFNLQSQRNLFNDAMVDVATEMPSRIVSDIAGNWWGFVAGTTDGPTLKAFDRLSDTIWTLGPAVLTRCGLSMSDDGTQMTFATEDNAGVPVYALWQTGQMSATLLGTDIIQTSNCSVPSSAPDHSVHIVGEARATSQTLGFFVGPSFTTVVQTTDIASVDVSEDFSRIEYTYATTTSERSTVAFGVFDRGAGDTEATTIDDGMLRHQPRTQFGDVRAYRAVPENCGSPCAMHVRVANYATHEVETIWEAAGKVHSVFHNAVIFEGADPADPDLNLRLMIAREVQP